MNAELIGIKRVEYTKKDTGEHKQGIELHLVRAPYPAEPYHPGSRVVFTEYIPTSEGSVQLQNSILGMKLPAKVNLVYVQNGRYANLVDVTPVA